jgi:diguanylate cyclase (GGDEF)-like protein
MKIDRSYQQFVGAMVRMPSRWRFIFLSVLLVAAIAAAIAISIRMQRDAAIAAFQTATANLGNGMSQQTSRQITSIDKVIVEIQAQFAAATDIKAAIQTTAIFDNIVEATRGLADVDALAVADANGLIEKSSSTWPSTALDVSRRDFFIHFSTVDDHNSYVGGPVKSESSGKWKTFLVRRINKTDGKFAGIVVAEISLAAIEDFYQVAMPARRSVSLLRSDGVVLVRYPPQKGDIGKKILENNPWYAVVARGGGSYVATDFFTTTPIVGFVRPLNNLPLVVQTSVSEDDVLADWRRQILWVVLAGGIIIIGTLLLLRHLAGQVNRLEQSKLSLSAKNDELKIAHLQFDTALSNISLGVCLFDSAKKLIVSNRGYRKIYHLSLEATKPGTTLEEMVDHRFAFGCAPTGMRDDYLRSTYDVVESGERRQTIVELVDGRAILVTHQPMAVGGWVSTHEDITERRKADRHIRFLAHHDMLTGLSNRVSFSEKLEHAAASLRRHAEPYTLFMLDIDKLKYVNDTFGHPAGDQLLIKCAERLKSSLRETDALARLGGDEFAIIQSGEENPREAAYRLATRIMQIFAEPFNVDGNFVTVGISIGIALSPKKADESTEMLKMADVALYVVKTAGRKGFRFFETAMLATADDLHHPDHSAQSVVRDDIAAKKVSSLAQRRGSLGRRA